MLHNLQMDNYTAVFHNLKFSKSYVHGLLMVPINKTENVYLIVSFKFNCEFRKGIELLFIATRGGLTDFVAPKENMISP